MRGHAEFANCNIDTVTFLLGSVRYGVEYAGRILANQYDDLQGRSVIEWKVVDLHVGGMRCSVETIPVRRKFGRGEIEANLVPARGKVNKGFEV